MEQEKYAASRPDSPMFNNLTCYFYFNGLAKGPRMEEPFVGGNEKHPDGPHNMTEVFERRVITTDGAQGDYILNHRLMALLGFYVCTAIFPSLPAAASADYWGFYEFRVRQYQAANGKGGSRDMRGELKSASVIRNVAICQYFFTDTYVYLLIYLQLSRQKYLHIVTRYFSDTYL
jgi:hypothetical protein